MKNFFNFNLSGSKLFPYYMVIYLLFILYFAVAVNLGDEVSTGNPTSLSSVISFCGVFFCVIIGSVIVQFFTTKLYITSVSYKDESLMFEGTLSEYVKVSVKGLLLTIVTLGVYSGWFQKNIYSFYASNTSYGNKKFKFNGKGLPLFIIVTAFVLVLFFVLGIYLGQINSEHQQVHPLLNLGLNVVFIFAIGALIYFTTFWTINFSYDNKTIKIKKEVIISGAIVFFKEMFFTVITLGIYYPAAIIKMYRFIIQNTEVRDENGVLVAEFGADLDVLENFLFIFAQLLLSIITFGIYIPWAICKIYSTLINKSFMLLKE